MEANEYHFEASSPETFRAKKKRKLIFSICFLLFAFAYLISGILEPESFAWIGGIVFVLMYSIQLWDNYHVKPVKIKITSTGVWMQQPETEINVEWAEVKKAVYNGRYLDLYVQSSLRETMDLQPFTAEKHSEILALIESYISKSGLSIKHLGVQRETPAT
ncbi:MAG: hypothetical protein MUE99_11275 [Chitinophagaceae bacterium]|nr:hypothetical protein [Chitinophagaceae bacterium]